MLEYKQFKQQTVEAEITVTMLSQRAREAENRAEYTSSNGPLRARGKAFSYTEYSATCGHT